VGTSTSNCTSAATTSGIFYVLNSTTLTGYTINSGAVTAISGATATFTGATAMAINSSGSLLFVASQAGITPFSINSSTGALTMGSTFGDQTAGALAVDPAGNWLLDASATGLLNAYPISSSGALDTSTGRTLQSPSLGIGSGSVQAGGIAISPSGYSNASVIAVAMGTSGTAIFPFTSSNTSSPIGTAWNPINPIGGVNQTAASVSVAIDPQNRILYIGETDAFNSATNSGALRAFIIGASKLNEFSYTTAYAPAGTGPHAILPSMDGNYVYAASWQPSGGEVTGYSVTSSALTVLSGTVTTGTQPWGLAEDSTGGYVLAVDHGGSPYLNAYSLASTGLLSTTTLTGSTLGSPIAIVAVP
jgi:6-phosphogluconolactonase (cycloisomerase 2 family)